jgi:phospholipase/carboxylesterase
LKRTNVGDLDVVLTGGTDREGGGHGPVVVLLHGFGAPGEDLVGLWRVLRAPPETRFVFPAGLLSLASEGYGPGRAWWRIDMAAIQRGEPRLVTEVPKGLAEARTAVNALLDYIENEWKVPSGRVVLGGFSQGAMLSLDVALRRRSTLGGVVLMSGTLIAADEWRTLLGAGPLPPMFQSHGREDPLLPFAVAEALRDTLMKAGAEVTWVPFRGGHEIPGGVLDGVGAFFERVLR